MVAGMGPPDAAATRYEGPEAVLSGAEQGAARNTNRARCWKPYPAWSFLPVAPAL